MRSVVQSKRITKDEADYKGPRERAQANEREPDRDCDDCTMFQKPSRCSLVIGHIDPEGVCKYFERKK